MPFLLRIQFGLRHLLLLVFVAALVSALVFREMRFQAATEELQTRLEQSRGVLKEHGLEWQLDDLSDDQVRITVFDYSPKLGTANVRGESFFAHKAIIKSIGPATVYSIDPQDPSATPRVICTIDAATDETGTATISMFAHHSGSRVEGFGRLEYSIDVSADGSARGSSYVGTIANHKQLADLLEYDLTSGDYPRGEPIPFFLYKNSSPERSIYLLVE